MSDDPAQILEVAGQACQQARLFGCTIDMEYHRRWGLHLHVTITPSGVLSTEDLEAHASQLQFSDQPTGIIRKEE